MLLAAQNFYGITLYTRTRRLLPSPIEHRLNPQLPKLASCRSCVTFWKGQERSIWPKLRHMPMRRWRHLWYPPCGRRWEWSSGYELLPHGSRALIAEVSQLPQLSVTLVRYSRLTSGAMSTCISAGSCMYWLELPTACERNGNGNHVLSRRLRVAFGCACWQQSSCTDDLIYDISTRLSSEKSGEGRRCVEEQWWWLVHRAALLLWGKFMLDWRMAM